MGSQYERPNRTKTLRTGQHGERGRGHPLFVRGGRGRGHPLFVVGGESERRGRGHPLFVVGGESERRRGEGCDGGQRGALGVPAVERTRAAPAVVRAAEAGVLVLEWKEALLVGG